MSSHSYEQATSYGRPLGHSPKYKRTCLKKVLFPCHNVAAHSRFSCSGLSNIHDDNLVTYIKTYIYMQLQDIILHTESPKEKQIMQIMQIYSYTDQLEMNNKLFKD